MILIISLPQPQGWNQRVQESGSGSDRTIALLDTLEPGPRGIYSGALGYIGADDSLELSVVIRTAICTPDAVTIGTGGAVTIDSDPDAEYEETILKTNALLRGYTRHDRRKHSTFHRVGTDRRPHSSNLAGPAVTP